MKTITVPLDKQAPDFNYARQQAVNCARDMLSEPVIVAWKDDGANRFGPEIPGGKDDRWRDYGESHAGRLQMTVGEKFHFIFAETADFDAVDLELSNIEGDDGSVFLCLNAACTEEDRRRLDDGSESGIGD